MNYIDEFSKQLIQDLDFAELYLKEIASSDLDGTNTLGLTIPALKIFIDWYKKYYK